MGGDVLNESLPLEWAAWLRINPRRRAETMDKDSIMKPIALQCGCEVSRKDKARRCRDCAGKFCGKHIYSYVDDSNRSITKNSPELCEVCYLARYGPVHRERPSRPSNA